MLISTTTILGAAMEARDGKVGTVTDIHFDDLDWAARYLVVDTGSWLKSENVLVSPHSVGNPDMQRMVFPVNLTREEVRKAPRADSVSPPTRTFERAYHDYYGYPFYWEGPYIWGGAGFPFRASVFPPPIGVVPQGEPMPETPSRFSRGPGKADAVLRSLKDLIGCHVRANDGDAGHIETTLLDNGDWTIRYLGVDTRHWVPGKTVAIPSEWVTDILPDERKVLMNRYRDEIREALEYPGLGRLSPDYARALEEHYAPGVRPEMRD